MKYIVTVQVTAVMSTTVEADTAEEARELAEDDLDLCSDVEEVLTAEVLTVEEDA